jgi:hypothetical protein
MSIIPIVQAAPAGTGRLAFTMSPYKEELLKLKPGAKAAVLALSLELVGVLVQGTYAGVQKGLGVVDIEQVYNPMPPLPSMVFPQEPVRAVTDFS